MSENPPFVSVIVPVLNGERTLRECLTSLMHVNYPSERLEILIVDNGSTDRTAEIIKSFPVQYLREARRGIPYARNRGIEFSRGEVIAFTDSDCMVSKGWLQELVTGFRDPKTGGMEGETLNFPPTTPVEYFIARTRIYHDHRRQSTLVSPYIITSNLAFRRDVFETIGKFDTSFIGGSDVDIAWRFFNDTDFNLGYNPKAIVFHRNRDTVRGFFSQNMRIGRGHGRLRKKYPSRLPWGFRQELKEWQTLSRFAFKTCREALLYQFVDGNKLQFYDNYFGFIQRLARRLGFLWENFTAR